MGSPVAVALSRYFVEPRRWTVLPGDWDGIFGRQAPLVVEIGFGSGEFLVGLARRRPEWNVVGFELSLTSIAKAARRAELADLDNVRLARVDGRFALRELFPAGSLQEVFVNFPCPWPKARHAPRRLADEGFAQALAGALKVGGEFTLVTDVGWYADSVGNTLEATGFRVQGPRPVSGGGPGTRYERKWRLAGREIFELKARLVSPVAPLRIAEGEMPHVLVRKDLGEEDFRSLTGLKETWPGGAFVVKEVAFSAGGRRVLVRVFSSDGPFQQQYFIVAASERDGWLVKLDGASVPFRTPAVKRSVYRVAALLGGRER